MPASRKRKKNGKTVSRAVSPCMAMYARLSQRLSPGESTRLLAALYDTLGRIAAEGSTDEYPGIDQADDALTCLYMDKMAAESPDDTRWNPWREFSRFSNGSAA